MSSQNRIRGHERVKYAGEAGLYTAYRATARASAVRDAKFEAANVAKGRSVPRTRLAGPAEAQVLLFQRSLCSLLGVAEIAV